MVLNLIVQTAFLGDLLLSIPLMKKCRELWPEDELALVCRKGLGEFFLKAGIVDKVFEVEKGSRRSYLQALEEIHKHPVRHLVSPHQSTRTQFFCMRVQAASKITYDSFLAKLIFTETLTRDIELPDALRQLSLVQNYDVNLKENLLKFKKEVRPYEADSTSLLPPPPKWGSMSLRKSILEAEDIWKSLKSRFDLQGFVNGKAILLFPGSVWATKRWAEEGFIGAGKELKSQGYSVYIMGGPGEEALSERIAKAIGVPSLAGKTSIFESAQLIARALLVIGNDSASTHLAAVCETPLIAIFGPTILEFGYRPWSETSFVVEEKGLSCRPCGKHGHHKCPIGTHACMKQIGAERVSTLAKSILQKYSPSH